MILSRALKFLLLNLSAAALLPLSAPGFAADLVMWERSGGNKEVVDKLVEMWNAKYSDRHISLTYIPHTEMVAKLAQALAAGDVPDLMGMDLIYAPQFEKVGQLVDLTDKINSWPELKTASPGHMMVATMNDRLYGVPLYADVSALFYNKDLFEKAGLDPNKPPTSLAELRAYADKITALGGDIKGYYLPGSCAGCNMFTVGPLMWASGGKIEAKDASDEPLVGDGVKRVLQFERDMVNAGNVHESDRAENGETFHLQFGSGKIGMMGTGNFNITLARDQNPKMHFGIGLLPGMEAGHYGLLHRQRPGGRAEGVEARRRRGRLHEVPALRRSAGRGLCQAPESHHTRRHGRQQILQGGAAGARRGQGADRRAHALHAHLLRTDQLAARAMAADAAARLLYR
jgi:multiple sugar transport system substrate-binding protein